MPCIGFNSIGENWEFLHFTGGIATLRNHNFVTKRLLDLAAWFRLKSGFASKKGRTALHPVRQTLKFGALVTFAPNYYSNNFFT
jgi:hypothetical protein